MTYFLNLLNNHPVFAIGYLCIISSVITLLFFSDKKISIFLFLAALFYILCYQIVDLNYLFFLIPFAIMVFNYYSDQEYDNLKFLYFIGIISLLIFMYFNINGIFKGMFLVQDVKVGETSSKTYSIRLLFLKSFVALIIAYYAFYRDRLNLKQILKCVIIFAGLNIIILSPLALYVKYIAYEPKFPAITYLWIINMLFTTCFVEEVIFRLFLQKELYGFLENRFKKHNLALYGSLLIAACVFGASHWYGGLLYMILATVAGIFYGGAFIYSGNRIEASMLVHFTINFTHLMLFSYPRL